ncbi:hypothetical protein [Butyrivibrio sp. FCS014]|nr:hypothetical protein [Butyrivibrio sp. FCS014]
MKKAYDRREEVASSKKLMKEFEAFKKSKDNGLAGRLFSFHGS